MERNKIRISLPPSGRWMHFAQESIEHYSATVGLSLESKEMCSGSVMEACEELIRKAAEVGSDAPIDLQLDYKGETLVIDIIYSAKIPLNPHKTEEYEIPDADTSLNDFEIGNLWLHMIKRRMDRVRFMVQGSRHVLRMIKYRRDAGKEKQAWVMSIKPELRKGVLLHLKDPEAEHPASTLHATGAGVLLLNPSQTFFIRNMDGKKSFHDLYMAHIDALGLTSPSMLATLYERLENLGMLVAPEEEANSNRWQRLVHKIVSFNLSIPNADGLVTAIHRRTRALCSPLGLGALLAIGASGFIPLWRHHAQFTAVVVGLEEAFLNAPLLLAPLYFLILAHISLHELGHGVACKHYGGAVPRLGIMFYLASFIFYCDTTAAWNFQHKRQRILVSLGGAIVSFAVLGAGLWGAGYFAGTDTPPEYILVAFCLFTLFSLAMNFNPFIKMDAYYMLLDYTGIPNLRERSFKFLQRQAFGWLGLGSDEDAKATLRERRIFWWYGSLGFLVTLLIFAVPFFQLKRLLGRHSASGGTLLFAVFLGALLVVRLGNTAYSTIRAMRYREYKIQ